MPREELHFNTKSFFSTAHHREQFFSDLVQYSHLLQWQICFIKCGPRQIGSLCNLKSWPKTRENCFLIIPLCWHQKHCHWSCFYYSPVSHLTETCTSKQSFPYCNIATGLTLRLHVCMVRTVERKSPISSLFKAMGKRSNLLKEWEMKDLSLPVFLLFFFPPTEDLVIGGLKLVDWGPCLKNISHINQKPLWLAWRQLCLCLFLSHTHTFPVSVSSPWGTRLRWGSV